MFGLFRKVKNVIAAAVFFVMAAVIVHLGNRSSKLETTNEELKESVKVLEIKTKADEYRSAPVSDDKHSILDRM